MAKKENNSVYIGSKPFFNYVTATEMQLGQEKKVIIKARGKNITKAIDVSEFILRNGKAKRTEIKISSDKYEKDGKELHISTIEMTLESQ